MGHMCNMNVGIPLHPSKPHANVHARCSSPGTLRTYALSSAGGTSARPSPYSSPSLRWLYSQPATRSCERQAGNMNSAARSTRTVYHVSDVRVYRRYEARVETPKLRLVCAFQDDDGDTGRDRGSFLWSGKGAGQQEKKVRLVKALFYAVQVFYSFFIM